MAVLGLLLADPGDAVSRTGAYSEQPVYLFDIPINRFVFGLTLVGFAVFRRKTLQVVQTLLGNEHSGIGLLKAARNSGWPCGCKSGGGRDGYS